MRARPQRLCLGLACLVGPAVVSAQSDTLWTFNAPAKIRYTRVGPSGHLLVATEQGLIALNPEVGSVAWAYPAGGRAWFRVSPLGHLLVGHGGVLTAVDPVTGDTVWHRVDLPDLSRAELGMSAADPYGIVQANRSLMALDLRSGVTLWDSTALPDRVGVREFFRLRDLGAALLIAQTPLSDAALLTVTLDSGRVLWRRDSLFRRPLHFAERRGIEYLATFQAHEFGDTTILLYFSEDGPMRLDQRTGAVLWRAEQLAGRSVPGRDRGYPVPRVSGGLALIGVERRLVALELGSGRVRWETERDFRDEPTWIVPSSGMIMVGGFGREKPFLACLDAATGARKWARDVELKREATAYFLRDTVYVSNDGALSAVPLATGDVRRLTEVGFQGGEHPVRMDTVEGGGLVLRARQNIMRVWLDGRVAYRRYYQAPGTSLLAKLASTALIVAANVGSIALTPPGGYAPVIVGNPVLAARYARAATAENYHYLFTQSPDSLDQEGFSLVLMDQRDGQELGRLWFDERSPDYGLDHVTATVYVREGDRQIVARRFRF
ncbi:MAG TPA: PQQ-binding-like beta-propeller repeat protein [Gemmatimonadales bacterium]|nr:PQQ-binding-like beta-propeller repeat protein [Gemmatimonadales bacterium]